LVSRLSHPTNAATNQALVQVTAPGLAILLAGPLNGWVFDHLGARVLLQLVALVGVFAAALLLVIRRPLEAREAEVQELIRVPVRS
jgi:predicted MFS family arabinose efflux permease